MPESDLQIRFGVVDTDKIVNALKSIEDKLNSTAGKATESSQKIEKSFTDLGDKAAKGIAVIGVAFAGMATAVATSVWKIVSSSSNLISEFDKMSQKTGIAIEDLQGLQYAAKMADVDITEVGMGLKFLAKNAVEAIGGTGDAANAFKSLGIDVKDVNKKLKPTNELLLELADKFSKLKDGPEKAALALKIFGRSGIDIIPFLNLGANELKKYSDQFKGLGTAIGDDLLQKNEEFERVTKNLSTALTGVKLTLANELFPTVSKYIDEIDKWIIKNKELVAVDIGKALGKITAALPSAEQMIGILNSGISALKYIANNIEKIIIVAKILAEILATIWVTTKIMTYINVLNTFVTGLEMASAKGLVLQFTLESIGWVLKKGIPLIAAFVAGWEIGKAINDWFKLGKVVDDLVAAREKEGDLSVQRSRVESATVDMLNEKYGQHFKTLAEWNDYLDQKKKESAVKQTTIIATQTKEELELKKQLTDDEIKEINKYIDEVKKSRGDEYQKLLEAYIQDMAVYGKTTEGKSAVDEKYFKLMEELLLKDEKKHAEIEQEKSNIKAKEEAARFAITQQRQALEDAAQAVFIQKQIDQDVATGNIFVNNTDAYLEKIYGIENISWEKRQELLTAALAVQKTKYENFVNKLNTTMGKVQGVVAGIDVAIKGDIVGGIQQVAAQLGPYGQVAAAGIGTAKMIVSWFKQGDDAITRHWKAVLRELDLINAKFAIDIASITRGIEGMDSATNEYISSVENYNTEWGEMRDKDTERMRGWKLVGDEWVKTGEDIGDWFIKVAEHVDHFKDRLKDLQEIQKSGLKVFEDQINKTTELIKRTQDFGKTIDEQITNINRRYFSSAELVSAYSKDIEELGKKYKKSLDPQEQLDLLDKIKSKIISRYEEQIKIINEAKNKIDAATESIRNLMNAASSFAESIDESIRGITRKGFTPGQNIAAIGGDIEALRSAFALATSPEEQLKILNELKSAQEELFNLEYENADTPEKQLAAQNKATTALGWIKEQGVNAYTNQIKAQQNIADQNQAIIDGLGDITGVGNKTITDLNNLQTSANILLQSLDTRLASLWVQMDDFNTAMDTAISGLQTMMTHKYASSTDIANLEKTIGIAFGLVPKTTASKPAGSGSYQYGGPVDRAGWVEPKHDAFVVTHEMLNKVKSPAANFAPPAINIPAPNVNVTVPAQKGTGQNIQITGAFFPGDVGRILSEIMYDQARAGAGRVQGFNKNNYGTRRINMRGS